MNEPNRPVSVREIDWDQVMLFRHLARALSLSLQPGRVIMGFMLIVALMVSGHLWDAVAGERIGPVGLAVPAFDSDATQATFRDLARNPDLVGIEFVEQARAADRIEARELIEAIGAHYRRMDEEFRLIERPEFEFALARIDAVRSIGTFAASVDYITDNARGITVALLHLSPGTALAELADIVIGLPAHLWRADRIFLIAFGAWALLLTFIGYGALSRSAACQFSIEQYLPWTTALAFAIKRWIPLAGTVVLPAVALGIGILMLALGGLLLAVPWLNILGAILYAVALVGGLIAAFILILMALSCSLFVPAIAVESADAPDALSRSFSYVRNRPMHWLIYIAVAIALGAIGWLLIHWVAALTLQFTAFGAGLFMHGESLRVMHDVSMTNLKGPDITWQLDGSHRFAGVFLYTWRTVVAGLVAGWIVTYDACACTVLYFLMRRVTDGQELDEIWQPGLIEGTMAPERLATPPNRV